MYKIFSAKNIFILILFTFVVSIIYISIRIYLAPAIAPSSDITIRVKSDYVLLLVQSIFGLAAILFPLFLKRRASLDIPAVMIIVYSIFLYCAIYLGEIRNFYYKVPHWDTILHTFSGAALGSLGFSIIILLNESDNIAFSLSPIFIALFSFCFAISLSVIWEIYEFSIDFFLHTNMQKYALETSEPLIGQAALIDTMKDLIVDAIGAFVISAIGYISLKRSKDWLKKFEIRRK